MSIKKISTLMIVAVFVSACSTPEEDAARAARNIEKYKDTSNRALCMSWMTSHSLNVHKKSKAMEISRRKIDCWDYGNVAEEQRKVRADFDAAVAKLGGSNGRRTTVKAQGVKPRYLKSSKTRSGQTLCYYDDGSVRNIGYSAVCPL